MNNHDNEEQKFLRFDYLPGDIIKINLPDTPFSVDADYSILDKLPRKAKELLKELNPSQFNAATSYKKYNCVIAGAGCGKTKTLVSRLTFLIAKHVDPYRINVLTFSRKAIKEIKARLVYLFGEGGNVIPAQTFHGWCLKILKRSPEMFRFKDCRIIDSDEQADLFSIVIAEEIKKRHYSNEAGFPLSGYDIASIYSFMRESNTTLINTMESFYPSHITTENIEFIKELIHMYEIRKRARNYSDFTDLVSIVANTVEKNEKVRKWLGAQYDYILIDEMQDIDFLQWKLVYSLSEYCNLFCVGDSAQAIFGFRGGDNKYMAEFKQNIPKSHILKLEANYRSTQEILNLSNWLLETSSFNYDKKLIALKGNGDLPQIHNFETIDQESAWIVSDLVNKKNLGIKFNDTCIIVRSSLTARPIEQILLVNDIPYRLLGGDGLLSSSHVSDVLSVLRILYNHADEIAWTKYLRLWVSESTALKIVPTVINASTLENSFDILQKSGMGDAKNILVSINQMKASIAEMINEIVHLLYGVLYKKYSFYKIKWKERVGDFQYVKKLAYRSSSIGGFLKHFVLDKDENDKIRNAKEDDKSGDAITIITVHSVKGLEYPICYVAGVNPFNYPSDYFTNRVENNFEEERRVLYVALTRAEKELIITRSRTIGFDGASLDLSEDEKIEYENSYLLNKLPSNLVVEINHDVKEKYQFNLN